MSVPREKYENTHRHIQFGVQQFGPQQSSPCGQLSMSIQATDRSVASLSAFSKNSKASTSPGHQGWQMPCVGLALTANNCVASMLTIFSLKLIIWGSEPASHERPWFCWLTLSNQPPLIVPGFTDFVCLSIQTRQKASEFVFPPMVVAPRSHQTGRTTKKLGRVCKIPWNSSLPTPLPPNQN